MITNILAAGGPVVVTSTKTDVLAAAAYRSRQGRCWIFDPTATLPGDLRTLTGVETLRWSPVQASSSWDRGALRMARLLAAAGGARRDHWRERAEAMLAALLHAAALGGAGMAEVQRWVLRQDLVSPATVLARQGADLACDVLAGLAATDHRELSGIYSSAARILYVYSSEAVLAAAEEPNFDPAAMVRSSDTVFVVSPSREQEAAAPVVVAIVDEIVRAAYEAGQIGGSSGQRSGSSGGRRPPEEKPGAPGCGLTLVLDEMANIAPLPGLAGIVSEGQGQGVLTVACLQDMSQARARWGPQADGFFTLFGTSVVLGGVRDVRTLEDLSLLCGEVEVRVRSTTRSRRPWSLSSLSRSDSVSTRKERRLPPAAIGGGKPGHALCLSGGSAPSWVRLTPCWTEEPWRALLGQA